MAWTDAFSNLGQKLDDLADKASPIEDVRNDASQANYNSQMANYKENAKSKEPLVQQGNKKPELLRYAKGGEVKLNFKNFKKMAQDEHSTTLQHPDGHEIKIAHKALKPEMKKQLDALPGYADGGDVEPNSEQQGGATESWDSPDEPVQPTEVPTNVQLTPPPQQPQVNLQPSMAPINQAVQEQEQGIQQQARAESDLGKREADLAAKQADQSQQLMQSYQQNFNQLTQERQAIMHDIQQNHIDPNRYMKNMSTSGQVSTAIGLLLSGMGSGMTGQPNAAMQVLQQNIDRDVEAQKADIGQKDSLLRATMQQFGNLHDATSMMRIVTTDAYANKVAQAAAMSKDPMAQARAQQLIGQLHMSVAPMQQQMAQRQTVMNAMQQGSTNFDPAMAVRTMVDDEQMKKPVFEEIQRAQNTRRMGDNIMASFDKAAKDVRPLSGGRLKNVFPGTESAYVEALHQAMQPTFSDIEQTVRQAAMDNTFKNITPAMGNSDLEIATKRKALENYLKSKSSAPIAKGFGIDLDRFSSTTSRSRPALNPKAPQR